MQKTELNEKPVGANCIRPHFGGMTLKKQKGITLIALIITIIVMLILVGVTINVALNGGLFQKAEQATKETEEKAILEEMLAMMEITDEGKINAQVIIDKMKEKYTVEGSIPNIIITGKLGTYNYIVSETEIKTGSTSVDYRSELEKYFFNSDSTGKTGLVIEDENTGIPSFKDDSSTIADASTSILLMNYGEGYITIEYKGADYRIDVENMDSTETVTPIIGSDNEKVTKLETIYEGNGEETKIKQYFLGYSGTGKMVMFLVDMQLSEQKGTAVFNNNDIISDASDKFTVVGQSGNIITLLYDNSVIYNLTIDDNEKTVDVEKVKEINEEEYPRVYSMVEGTNEIYFIEISETEGVFASSINGYNLVYKKTIEPCTEIEYIEGFEGVEVKNESNITYSKLAQNNQPIGNFVYNQEQNKWIIITAVGSGSVNYFSIGSEGLSLNYTMSEEQINNYIEAAS